jgi:hypothetical protein
MSKLQPAISRLAALYPYGELAASTDPVNFLDGVTKEVTRLRAIVEAAITSRRRFGPEWAAPFTELDEALEAHATRSESTGGGDDGR